MQTENHEHYHGSNSYQPKPAEVQAPANDGSVQAGLVVALCIWGLITSLMLIVIVAA